MNRISVQVKTHLYPEEVDKLDKIVEEYNFKSRYQLVQTILRCFLKGADPKEDEVVSNEFIEMFEEFETASIEDCDTVKRGQSI